MKKQSSYSELAVMLKKGREFSGLTTRDAGERAGVSFAYLNQMENGRVSRPSPSTLFKLSRLYSLPFEFIMEKAGHVTDDADAAPVEITRNLAILLISGNDVQRETCIKLLSRPPFSNCMFIHAKSGGEGISLGGKTQPDCIILDCALPDMEGVDAVKALKKGDQLRHVPLVFIADHSCVSPAILAMMQGASAYVMKEEMQGEILARAVISAVKSSILHRFSERAAKLRKGDDFGRLAKKVEEVENLALLLESTTGTPAWSRLSAVDRAVCGGVKQLAAEISAKIVDIRKMMNSPGE